MKIYRQLNENDCGISIIQSLYHYKYKKEIESAKIIEAANITNEGLNVFELERLGAKLGIFFESFELSFDEFNEIKTKKYFVTLIAKENFSHFVIARKNNKFIDLYDSVEGRKRIPLHEFKRIFLNIYIRVEFADKKPKHNFYLEKNIGFLDVGAMLKLFFLELCLVGFLLLSVHLNKLFFTDVVHTAELKNLGIITFIGFLIYLAWVLCDYLKTVLKIELKKQYHWKLYEQFFQRIVNKKNNFYQKLGKYNLLHLNQHINNIAVFCSEHISEWIVNIVVTVALMLYLLWLNHMFLIILIVSFLFQITYTFTVKKIKDQYVPKLVEHSNLIKKSFFQLNEFLREEWNSKKLSSLIEDVKNNVAKDVSSEAVLKTKNAFYEKINFLIFNLSTLSVYGVGSFWYIQDEIDLASLLTIGFIFYFANKSFDKIVSSYFFYSYHANSLEHYKQWIRIGNLRESDSTEEGAKKIKFVQPKTISLKNLYYHNGKRELFNGLNLDIKNNTFLFGSSGIGKSTLYKLICGKLYVSEDSVFFDEIPIGEFDALMLNEKIVYQKSDSYLDSVNWGEIMKEFQIEERRSLANIISKLHINVASSLEADELSSGQKQFLNLIKLMTCRNKILLLDECTSHIDKEVRDEIIAFIFPKLSENNFVVCSEHDLNLSGFFDHSIKLDEVIGEQEPI